MKRAVSIILVFAMFCEISTPLVYAAGDTGLEAASSIIANDAVYSSEVAEVINNTSKGELLSANDDTVLAENTDRREENTKSYRLTNGSNAVFLYPIAVHEKDAAGEWVEIDNLLKETEEKDGERFYSVKGINTETVFQASPTSGRFLDLSTESGHITWGLSAA